MLPEEVLQHLLNPDRIAIQVVMEHKGEYTLNVGDYGYINLLKLHALNKNQSVTRIGIGTGDYSSWSKVKLSDGSEVYVASK